MKEITVLDAQALSQLLGGNDPGPGDIDPPPSGPPAV